MSANSLEEADLTEGLVGVETYEAPTPTKKTFRPWHKPRKQFVREKQWCEQIRRLLDDGAQRNLDDGTLKYCGLPGIDLIDLRCFHEVICVPRSIKLRFLGFNSAVSDGSPDQIELNISRDEIAKLDQIDPISEVIPDDIRTVANRQSIAYTKITQFGPFNVVNLDLCDSFGAEEAGQFTDNYYNALAQIMAIQARQMTPWLLFLTTRVGNDHVHNETLKRFAERYAKNLAECEEFKKESSSAFEISDEAGLSAALSTATGFHKVFLVGICKWLLGMAIGHKSSIEVRSVLGYRVVGSAPETDLVSFAVRFVPHQLPANDPHKLVAVPGIALDECAMSTKALRRVARHKDVDAIIASDDKLLEQMIEKTSTLLGAARYDISVYASWAVSKV